MWHTPPRQTRTCGIQYEAGAQLSAELRRPNTIRRLNKLESALPRHKPERQSLVLSGLDPRFAGLDSVRGTGEGPHYDARG